MNDFYYRKLDAYQLAKALVKEVYLLLRSFPVEEQYALCSQMRRSAISIPSNIAEGMGRMSIRERIHFLEISYGSLAELMCQLELSHDLGYLADEVFSDMEMKASRIAQTLSGLRRSLESKI